MHAFKLFKLRLRQSHRRRYVIARRVFKFTVVTAFAISLFAIYRSGLV
jgi:hypothetical protein